LNLVHWSSSDDSSDRSSSDHSSDWCSSDNSSDWSSRSLNSSRWINSLFDNNLLENSISLLLYRIGHVKLLCSIVSSGTDLDLSLKNGRWLSFVQSLVSEDSSVASSDVASATLDNSDSDNFFSDCSSLSWRNNFLHLVSQGSNLLNKSLDDNLWSFSDNLSSDGNFFNKSSPLVSGLSIHHGASNVSISPCCDSLFICSSWFSNCQSLNSCIDFINFSDISLALGENSYSDDLVSELISLLRSSCFDCSLVFDESLSESGCNSFS
jgi:hypothetical protein